ncbi:hypothetical protein ACMGDH_00820 [Sphingomonas sp. DT-207]|uniref:hypothetical protein n=1 Tax=Sphingomonas sp. DT-207 TaxID=3396167 RepID=UPI003F1D6E28
MKLMVMRAFSIVPALGACVLPASVDATPRKELALDSNSESALVVMKTEWWQPAPSMKSAFRLTLTSYDPIAEKLLGKPFGGSAEFAAQKKKFLGDYLVMRVKPGRWVFQSYSQQDKWALCFNAGSWQFEVKPGRVVYLGEFDSPWHRERLTEEALRSGKVSISGYGFADFFDLPEGPRFRPVDTDQLAAVRDMLGRQAPAVTAPVEAAEYSPAKFGTGSTLFGERVCGGYFVKGAKKKDDKAQQ